MSIFISNFGRRIADLIKQNRARLIKLALIVAAILAATIALYLSIEKIQSWRYEKRVQALEKQYQAADARAKELEAQAEATRQAIDSKQAEVQFLEARAQDAEKKLQQVRTIVLPLKETYEQARNTPVAAADTSCADVCAELARLGHPCQQ
jgi:uncharacterized protein HemX